MQEIKKWSEAIFLVMISSLCANITQVFINLEYFYTNSQAMACLCDWMNLQELYLSTIDFIFNIFRMERMEEMIWLAWTVCIIDMIKIANKKSIIMLKIDFRFLRWARQVLFLIFIKWKKVLNDVLQSRKSQTNTCIYIRIFFLLSHR